MNTARKLLDAIGIVSDHPDADLEISVEQNRAMRERYLAPHANRGTPPRPHHVRVGLKPRLFKGHRP
jgi:hypothetical protein